MGASDWAGRMVERLEEEFGTSARRNTQMTSLIRLYYSHPDYQQLKEEMEEDWEKLKRDLPSLLRKYPGNTIEEKWNRLMDEWGYQEEVDAGVYLRPWDEVEVNSDYIDVHKRVTTDWEPD